MTDIERDVMEQDVHIVGAQGADRGNDQALDEARARIAELVHLETKAA